MESYEPMRVGYVLKMYPRFSETFVVNEMLAHQAARLDFEIFSLRPPIDGRFHESLARLHVPVTYIGKPGGSHGARAFWELLGESSAEIAGLMTCLEDAVGENVNDVYQAIMLARMARERNITHLHAHFASTATSVTRLASRLAGVSYSFTAHAKDIYHESVQPDDLRRKLSEAAAAITVSDYNLFFLRSAFGSDADRVQRVYNGINLDQFQYASPKRRPRRIISVGRLVEKKGLRYLIEACHLLVQRGAEFECEIIGAGPLEPELRAQIENRELGRRVRLVGPLPQGDVIQEMREAAVVAAPCVLASDGDRDGLPTVLLEAMALGTPCVSTDVTGIPEILRDGITGLMIPQGDSSALAAALERLLDDSELRVRLSQYARKLIEDEFDLSQNASRIREAIAAASRPKILV